MRFQQDRIQLCLCRGLNTATRSFQNGPHRTHSYHNSNPRSAIVAREVSPCLELPDYEGQTYTEAFETYAAAEAQSDESVDGVFWGVYARLNEVAIAEGNPPSLHMRDFETRKTVPDHGFEDRYTDASGVAYSDATSGL